MRFWRICLATAALVPFSFGPLWANPLGGTVVDGGASIQGMGTSQVTVTQTTDRAALEWRSFDIEQGETTRFVQPSADSVILNRVTGGQNASHLYGTLESNGTVYLVNPDGILFGPSAVVDTGSFLATTHDIKNSDFMSGIDRFSANPGTNASVVNEGTITAHDGGFAALVAPGVRNDGVIVANLGTVGMSAVGDTFSLDLRGDQLINFAVSDQIAEEVKDARTGEPLKSFVENKGKIKANGGHIELTAATARKVVDSVIKNSGVLEANTVSSKGGKIILGAATGNAKGAVAAKQIVKSSGKISARGTKSGQKGGKIQITGEVVALQGAKIDAGGTSGGGTILLGGDYHGGQPVPNSPIALESKPVPNADYLYVDNQTIVDASAYSSGNGGKVILWGNQANLFGGSVTARGGRVSGNGGFVEVSSPHNLAFEGQVDTSSPGGNGGQLFLDPQNLTIDDTTSFVGTTVSGDEFFFVTNSNIFGTVNDSHISARSIEAALAQNGVVTVLMSRPYNTDTNAGLLTINADITAPANNSWLEFVSSSDWNMNIVLNSTIDFSQSTGEIRLGGIANPALSIRSSQNAKIIGNTGYVYFDALSVGTSSAPIRVEIVPDSDATTANYIACANYLSCSDTGTRIAVSDAYMNDPGAFHDNVFVSASLRSGYSVPTPGGGGDGTDPGNGGGEQTPGEQVRAKEGVFDLWHVDRDLSLFGESVGYGVSQNRRTDTTARARAEASIIDGHIQLSALHGEAKNGAFKAHLDALTIAAGAKIRFDSTGGVASVGARASAAEAEASYKTILPGYNVTVGGSAGIGVGADISLQAEPGKFKLRGHAALGGMLGIDLSIEKRKRK
ncbi:filamentous hemagglutinin N-terminal domain-containing protein [Mesorhizobium sp. M2D.F.Ca.ET.233.01.1.1]|uniref:two-partner secretion domain-containing protein n=1 Tax=Mesorhizobium sp. M2D.F.Ca.ET.233.01.1.1 TaxID=2563943 RepID=UPI001093F30A|nr:filamentous hemagglutinin N-terminal domain-containing protein [Mesorhizobium sp. M2D.F.Ca.ET.233.01.1.1]TGP14617.1 filamentous hemagglutinin N-terminal domain-containing protein [Mesorhizobium sp. M2D.F.Ca.ET.233.01.1.1]TGV66814.1 filamentous hemagglutinin N-terminal domain-containing protein [Mesorhizobium sp. M2D.F.Ca.ET.160.01.1.1]